MIIYEWEIHRISENVNRCVGCSVKHFVNRWWSFFLEHCILVRFSEIFLETSIQTDVLLQLFLHLIFFSFEFLNSSSQCVDFIGVARSKLLNGFIVSPLKPINLGPQVCWELIHLLWMSLLLWRQFVFNDAYSLPQGFDLESEQIIITGKVCFQWFRSVLFIFERNLQLANLLWKTRSFGFTLTLVFFIFVEIPSMFIFTFIQIISCFP